MYKKSLFVLMSILIIMSMMLGACAPAAPAATQAPATEAPAAATEAPAVTEAAATEAAVTEAPATEAPAAEAPAGEAKVGGTFRYAQSQEADTLDPQKTNMLAAAYVLSFVGAALVNLGPDGDIVPWLAKSWDVSEDGLVWTFHLRDDVKFTNGDPLTAKDFEFTYKRALDPETASVMTASNLGPTDMDSFKAVDDYTFQITLKEPFYPLLISLSDQNYMMPLSEKAYTTMDNDELALAPISCGPYTVESWERGSKITLKRNPDYNWGPEDGKLNTGPWYFETVEVYNIPEYQTILAGLEAGEIDYASLDIRDVDLIRDTGIFDILEATQQGPRPFFLFNTTVKPFDDVKVRQAFNQAVDRDAFIQVLTQGKATYLYGPLTPSQIGYWDGVEKIGYKFELDKAKALMQEAGYTYDANNMLLTPDGQPLKLTVDTLPVESWVKAAEVLSEQLKALGVQTEIAQKEPGILIQDVANGNYTMSAMGISSLDGDMLFTMFHSSNIGANNMSQYSEPELDAILERTRKALSEEERTQAFIEAQTYIVEKPSSCRCTRRSTTSLFQTGSRDTFSLPRSMDCSCKARISLSSVIRIDICLFDKSQEQMLLAFFVYY